MHLRVQRRHRFFFLAKTIPFMVIGVIFAELIIALKVVDKIAFVARPITNFAHLRDECGASFLTAFASATSANAMLAAFYKDGLIEKRELFIASMPGYCDALASNAAGVNTFAWRRGHNLLWHVNTCGVDKDSAYNDCG